MVGSEVVDLVIAVLVLLAPEGEVLLEELNDGLGITEVVLLELINLVESLLEGGVSEGASISVVLHDFVVEDREVESKTKLDGVASGKFYAVSFVVSAKGSLLDFLKFGILGVLRDVAVVVTNHLDEEGLGLTVAGLGEDLIVDDSDDTLAVSDKLILDAGLVGGESGVVLAVLGVLLNGSDSAASGSLGRDEVLEGNRDEVALVGGDIGTLDVED